MFDFTGAMADFQELHYYSRRYPKLLTPDELEEIGQREFIRYCRENLWEKIAKEKFNKPFDELTFFEMGEVDFDALMKIALAQEQVRKEDENNIRNLLP